MKNLFLKVLFFGFFGVSIGFAQESTRVNDKRINNLLDYFGPSLSLKYETEWVSDYQNLTFAELGVRRQTETQIVENLSDDYLSIVKQSEYDNEGFLTDVELFNSTVVVQTNFGKVNCNKRKRFIYENNRRRITEVTYTKFLNEMDTLYVKVSDFDIQGRRVVSKQYSYYGDYTKEWFYYYDAHDNCVTEGNKNGSGLEIEYLYNKEGLLINETVANNGSHGREFIYKDKRLVNIVSFNDTISIAYNDSGYVKKVSFNQSNLKKEMDDLVKIGSMFPLFSFIEKGEFEYFYDKNNRLVSRSYRAEDKEYYMVGEMPNKIVYSYLENGLLESAREVGLDDGVDVLVSTNKVFFYDFWE